MDTKPSPPLPSKLEWKDAVISNRYRSQNNYYFNEISSLNASEKSRQQVPQQGTPTTGHHTPSAVTPYVNLGKMPEFQIALVVKPSTKSA
jgi:hypothetical protein